MSAFTDKFTILSPHNFQFRDREVTQDGSKKTVYYSQPVLLPMERFEKERHAYASLLAYGACNAGAVPMCYGWLTLSATDIKSIHELPDTDESCLGLDQDDGPPKALLLQYFSDAQQLSAENITPQIADNAMRMLYHVHASYVMHNDVHRRNILVLPDNRVVWIDFDSCFRHDDPDEERRFRRQDLFEEFSWAWTHFYDELVWS